MRFVYIGPSEEPEEELLAHLFCPHEAIAVDVETISLSDRTLIGIGVAINPQEAFYFPILPQRSPYADRALEFIQDSSMLHLYHNAMFDLEVLGIDGRPFADTSIMAQMQGLPANLKDLTHFYLGREIKEVSDLLAPKKTMLSVDTQDIAHKCLEDVLATYQLWEKFGGRAWEDSSGHSWSYRPNYENGYNPLEPTTYYVSPGMKDCYQVDIKLMPLLRRMSARGIALRPNQVVAWYEQLSQEVLFYRDICTQEGFDPNSNQQVGYVLASRRNVLPFTRSRKQLKVDEDTLLGVNDPLAALVLLFRKRAYLLSHYIKPCLGLDRAYTHFRMDLSTRRLASFDFNLQNIPVDIREIYAPDRGTWTWMDYSQVEMRMFAHLTKDPTMVKAYRDGEDIHWITQQALWPGTSREDNKYRKPSKTFGFAMIYDASEPTLAKKTRLPLPTCTRFRGIWLARYPVAAAWMKEQAENSYKGYVDSLFGRKMRLPSLDMSTPGHREKCAINYPVQGPVADIVKRAMLKVEDADLVLQVHDELLCDGEYEFPKGLENILDGLYTPFEVKSSLVWR